MSKLLGVVPLTSSEKTKRWREKDPERARAAGRRAWVLYDLRHPGRKQEQVKRSHAKRFAAFGLWLAAKKAGPCVDCGGSFPRECMDFDHVRGTKLFEIGQASGRPRANVEAELEKCDLVCANCHRIRTYSRAITRRSA